MNRKRALQLSGLAVIVLMIAGQAYRRGYQLTAGEIPRTMNVRDGGAVEDLAHNAAGPRAWLIVNNNDDLLRYDRIVAGAAQSEGLTVTAICSGRSQCAPGVRRAADRRTVWALDGVKAPALVVLTPDRRVGTIVTLGDTNPDLELLRTAMRAKPESI